MYNLKMNEEKTKLVKFSRRKQQLDEKQETFDFLGFTFYMGKSRRGKYLIKVKTKSKSIKAKLKKVNEWAREIRNKHTLNEIMEKAASKLRGHIQYYGVTFNFASVSKFAWQVRRILFKWINRRSQRKSFTEEQFSKYLDSIKFPKPKICFDLF
jgi:RNA-directed DNA polymerase